MAIWLATLTKDKRSEGGVYAERTDAKGVLHTTETGGWPSYNGWTICPQITVKPIPGKGVEGRQHIDLERSGMALRNESGGVETNRDYAVQIELIGTCDKATANKYGYYYWPDADDAVLIDLYNKVILPVSRALKIPVTAVKFQSYPHSYGERNPNRMGNGKWDGYNGWCGHQHVPENSHGDPGAFPWDRMMTLVKKADDGLDMDAADVFNAVWKRDDIGVPAELTTPDNPTWMPQSLLREAALRATRAEDNTKKLAKDLESTNAQAMQAKNEAASAKTAAADAAGTARRTEETLLKLIADLPALVRAAVADAAVDVNISVNGKVVE